METEAIVPFVEKLMERNVHPVTFARIECETEESRRKFFERAVYILDKHVSGSSMGRVI